jgi:predicted Rossmann-fold nucleotide-binding protein
MREIHEIDRLEEFLARENDLSDCVVQGLNLGEVKVDWTSVRLAGSVFLGCRFPSLSFQERVREGGALIFPRLPRLPYNPYRPGLYSRDELMEGWTPENDRSADRQIFEHFESKGRHRPHVMEALCQRLHDHAIDDALMDLLEGRVEPGGAKKVVAIMGGHGAPRTDPYSRKVAAIARDLTRAGYFVASGGGPGIMEAANLGAWISNGEDEFLDRAIGELSSAPRYDDAAFNEVAARVREWHPDGASSLAIPTWFYGHEPSNQFSVHIAKYFSNGLREDGLLAIARYGVIYAPGSAGTTQEIFMDAAQNHYGTFEYVSPMIFLGADRYGPRTGLYETLQRLAKGRQYESMLALTDDAAEVVRLIGKFEPEPFGAKMSHS